MGTSLYVLTLMDDSAASQCPSSPFPVTLLDFARDTRLKVMPALSFTRIQGESFDPRFLPMASGVLTICPSQSGASDNSPAIVDDESIG